MVSIHGVGCSRGQSGTVALFHHGIGGHGDDCDRTYLMDRQAQASLTSRMGYRIVEVLNTATVAGLLMAVAAFFWANRLLPLALPDRSHWEIRCFFIVWGLWLVHSLPVGLFTPCSMD